MFPQCLAEVLRRVLRHLPIVRLPFLRVREGISFVVIPIVEVALVLPERGGLSRGPTLQCTTFACDALDEHADGHAGGEAVGVEEDVRRDAAVRPRHVLGRPQKTHHTFLPMPRGKLISHYWISRVAESKQRPPC